MTERERWIVYPLLFLALGAAMRDKIFNLTRTQQVLCERLAVYRDGDQRFPVAILGSERQAGNPLGDMIQVNHIRSRVIDVDEIRYRGRRVNLSGATAPAIDPAQFWQWLQENARQQQMQRKSESGAEEPAGGKAPEK